MQVDIDFPMYEKQSIDDAIIEDPKEESDIEFIKFMIRENSRVKEMIEQKIRFVENEVYDLKDPTNFGDHNPILTSPIKHEKKKKTRKNNTI